MKVTREKTENSQAFLTIEMEPTEVEKSLEVAYHHLVGRANIPGFRKGKAPRAVLERYLGKEALLEDAIDHMIPEAYEKALNEQKIEAFAQPHIEVAQTEPVIFKAVVPLPPVIELSDYHHIQVKPEPAETKEDDVILKVGISSEVHYQLKKYPDALAIINRLKPVNRLVIAGFHRESCVEKVAMQAHKEGLDVLVDEDLTELFPWRILLYPEFKTGIYPSVNPYKSMPDHMAQKSMEARTGKPWLWQNYPKAI